MCQNYRQIIRSKRTGQALEWILLRNGLKISTVGTASVFLAIFREIFHKEVYIRGLKRQPMKVIVDIGAHAGLFSLQAALLWPQAKIFAYEPAPENFGVLLQNINQNNLFNISAYNLAVASGRDEIQLFIKQQPERHTMFDAPASEQTQDVVWVGCTDLPGILKQLPSRTDEIDLLKVDCEGCEYEMIPPALELLSKRVKRIVMEFHQTLSEWLPREHLAQPLMRAGFDVDFELHPRGNLGLIRAVNRSL